MLLTDAEIDAYTASEGTPDDPAEEAAILADVAVLAGKCEENAGALIDHMGTIDAARDLDIARAVTQDPVLNYLGLSYGTALGFAYVALRHDPKVAVILAGVAAAAVGLLLQVTLKIGWKQLIRPQDLVFVIAVFVAVGLLHISMVVTLVTLAPIAIWMYRPRAEKEAA